MKKHLLTFTILFMSFFVAVQPSFAADQSLTCNSSGWETHTVSALFPSSETWWPGKTKSWKLTISNTSGILQDISANASGISTTGNIDQVINLAITKQSDSSTIWNGSLNSFYSNGIFTILSNMSSGTSEVLIFTGYMDINAGNEYQNKTTQFDLEVGCNVQSSSSSITGKTSSLSLSCTNTNFDAIMELKDGGVGQSGIKIKFKYKGETKEVLTDANGKAVAGFSYSSDDEVRGEPEGGFGTQTATIHKSDCKESSTSSTGGGGGGTGGGTTTSFTETILGAVAPFFGGIIPGGAVEGEVAGAETSPSPKPSSTPSVSGEIKGVETAKCSCIWWQILLGQAVALVLYYFILIKKDIRVKKRIIAGATGISAITYIIFLFLNPCLKKFLYIFIQSAPSIFCKWFILLDIVLLATASLLWKIILKKKEDKEIFTEKE